MSAVRQRDTVKVQIIGSTIGNVIIPSGKLENFTSLVIRNDITSPSEASFELGDDGTFDSMAQIFQPGVQFQVSINNKPRLRGRVEMNDVPFDAGAGAAVRFTVRTKLSDAMFASARYSIKVKGVSIKTFILALYAQLGYEEKDFVFDQSTARNLITGKKQKRDKRPKNLERIKIPDARVKPPETIYAVADRHLRRYGLMHWDSPDGKIVVGAPNDEQDPIYTFNMYKSKYNKTNNMLSATRTQDWSGVPTYVNVHGVAGKFGYVKSRVSALVPQKEVIDAGFYRPLHIMASGIRNQQLAAAAAAREMAARTRRMDTFDINVDGFSSWNGQEGFLYAPDTVVAVNTDVAGGNGGAYYIHATTLTRNATDGDTTQISALRRGLWDLEAKFSK